MKIKLLIIFLYFNLTGFSQNTITGTFPNFARQQIKLVGFNGFETQPIDSVKTSEKGVFNLTYGKNDYGMGYLATENNEPFLIVLSGENIKLKGLTFAQPETTVIIESQENMLFEQYTSEYPRREQALYAWDYLAKIYRQDPLFAVQGKTRQAIASEKQRIKTEDSLFLASLAPETYISWYLPLRKLVSAVSVVAQYRTAEIPATIASFRKIDYTDPRLFKSGLLGDVIESHFWLIENSGRSLDSVYVEMKTSINHMIENLLSDEKKLNELTEYLFKFLEKRSLFEASEYLAIKLLHEKTCTINNNFTAQLESYRAMKKGNRAPDIVFTGDVFAPGYETGNVPEKLSDIKSNFTVVVFGSSWCPQCPQELERIARVYEKWNGYGVEVLFVSLDDDKEKLKKFTSIFPFISTCDYQKWESPAVKNYHVFATPAIYLLNNKQEILLRPNSVKQLDSWVDRYFVKGNSY